MKIALVGYGKMGKTIERLAKLKGYQIVSVIDKDNLGDFKSEDFASADVAIEFTTPETAVNNIITCLELGKPVVCGTTGWTSKMEMVKKTCAEKNGTLFYASNYSLGVNIFFHLNRQLAKIMNTLSDYDVTIEETHHIHKLDVPSGTAITLAEDTIKAVDRKTQWSLEKGASDNLHITAIRKDEVPGTHIVSYLSEIDKISLTHEAYSRDGFATGAIMAAEFIKDKKGVYSMHDLLNL